MKCQAVGAYCPSTGQKKKTVVFYFPASLLFSLLHVVDLIETVNILFLFTLL